MKEVNYIQGLIDGNDAIVEQIYKIFLPKVTYWVKQNHGTDQDGFDVFQDGLEALVTKGLELNINPTTNFTALLFTICRNKWISKIRLKKKEELVRFEELSRFSNETNIQIELEESNQEQQMKRMLKETFILLSPLCQQLIPLVENKVPAKEIAVELSMTTANAVHRRKFACFEAWRKRIEKHNYYPNWKSLRSS